jgi:hypothetical protein
VSDNDVLLHALIIINLYLDPHNVMSSERDHARATFKAHTSTDRVVSKGGKNILVIFFAIHINICHTFTGTLVSLMYFPETGALV